MTVTLIAAIIILSVVIFLCLASITMLNKAVDDSEIVIAILLEELKETRNESNEDEHV